MKCKREKNIFYSLLFIFLFSALSFSVFGTAYYYGYNMPRTTFYSSLMSIDKKLKLQNTISFLHGSLKFKYELDDANKAYNEYVSLQKKTHGKTTFYNSYLMLAQNGDNIFFEIETNNKEIISNKSSIIHLPNYYDYNYAESIGLPLFFVSDKPSTINPKNQYSNYGSYISSTCAESIVKSNGMLDMANGDLKIAFDNLLGNDSITLCVFNDYYNEGTPIYFSINNIYIDPIHNYLFNDYQNKYQMSNFGNYSKTFSYWNANSILTYAPDLFKNGSAFYFDIRENYGNFDKFFNEVVGYNFSAKEAHISLFDENGSLYEESNYINEASINYENQIDYILIFLALLFLTLFFAIYLLLFFKMHFYNLKVLCFIPHVLFLIIQLIFSLLSSTLPTIFLLYKTINSIGNIIVLIFLLLLIILFFACYYYEKKNKNQN